MVLCLQVPDCSDLCTVLCSVGCTHAAYESSVYVHHKQAFLTACPTVNPTYTKFLSQTVDESISRNITNMLQGWQSIFASANVALHICIEAGSWH